MNPGLALPLAGQSSLPQVPLNSGIQAVVFKVNSFGGTIIWALVLCPVTVPITALPHIILQIYVKRSTWNYDWDHNLRGTVLNPLSPNSTYRN